MAVVVIRARASRRCLSVCVAAGTPCRDHDTTTNTTTTTDVLNSFTDVLNT